MESILTPTTLWDGFDDTIDTNAEKVCEREVDGIVFEDTYFYGRETGKGRVKIFGTYAYSKDGQNKEPVLILPDSSEGVNDDILRLFAERGYSALMVEYRGEYENAVNRTVYPENIDYANISRCGRHKDYVDDTADNTSWYEWVALGIYARKYALERSGGSDIAVVGIRDGGEIAWKLAAVRKFACAVPVCAAGWLAYFGINKYVSDEQNLDSERFRFIAGIDSQAYAPFVQCPILIMCSTNDPRLDYDRAYDTFSRINPDFADESVITYTLSCDETIGMNSTADMFLFLEKYLGKKDIVIPQAVDVNINVDDEQNLIAVAKYDNCCEIEEAGLFYAEDCLDPSLRDWSSCRASKNTGDFERVFFPEIFEETSTLFALGYAKYKNGFTVWSKIAVKKISGRFKNTVGESSVLFSGRNGTDGFYISEPKTAAIGGVFFTDGRMKPQLVTKTKGIKGIYSEYGLSTYRMNSAKYSPKKGSFLKIDVFCDNTADIDFALVDLTNKEVYKYSQNVIGGVWQSIVLESKFFKNDNGVQVAEYGNNFKFLISCNERYAVNNIIWL